MVNERGTLFRFKKYNTIKEILLFYNLKSLKHQQQISIMSFFFVSRVSENGQQEGAYEWQNFIYFFPVLWQLRELSDESNGASDYAYFPRKFADFLYKFC